MLKINASCSLTIQVFVTDSILVPFNKNFFASYNYYWFICDFAWSKGGTWKDIQTCEKNIKDGL